MATPYWASVVSQKTYQVSAKNKAKAVRPMNGRSPPKPNKSTGAGAERIELEAVLTG